MSKTKEGNAMASPLNSFCEQCGDCCKFITFNMSNISEDMREHINAHKNMTVIRDRVFIKSKCKYLKKNKCSIYPMQFNVCRYAGCIKNDTDYPLIKKWLYDKSR